MIGTGGKVIREICEVTGAKIDIEDDGTVKVAAVNASVSQAAIDWIRGIVAEPELGVIYSGKVVKTVDFGAFVNFLGARDGLVHISELAPHRVGKTTDIVKVGDQVKVKVLGFDDRGKVKLSMKQVNQATGEDISARVRRGAARAARPRGSKSRDLTSARVGNGISRAAGDWAPRRGDACAREHARLIQDRKDARRRMGRVERPGDARRLPRADPRRAARAHDGRKGPRRRTCRGGARPAEHRPLVRRIFSRRTPADAR